MNITWAKVGAVLAVICPPIAGGAYLASIDTKVQAQDKRIDAQDKRFDALADMPAAVARIDERTIAIQRAIDALSTPRNEDRQNAR
jgi:hypothetical protein